MSDFLALAAITNTLRNLLDSGLNADAPLAGTTVTTRPPDKARSGINGSQVNLFLHRTAVHATWRNMDIPQRTKSGESSHPPLPLTLHYLITAYYGENDDNVDTTTDANRILGTHRLLGRVMGILHDNPLLDTAVINAQLPPADRLDHPYQQVERVRITPEPMSVDELSKLWSGFQTQYRLAAAYELSVVLIESSRPATTPLPVLTIGLNNAGVAVQPNLLPPFPTLDGLSLPNSRPAAILGDLLTFTGHHLQGDAVALRFSHVHLPDPITLPALVGATDKQIQVQLPNAPANWPPGVYTAMAVISQAGQPDKTTNDFAFILAPRILTIAPNPAPRNGNGDVTLTITCSPQIRPAQRVSLLLGSREVAAQPHPAQTATLTFAITDAPAGTHFVRLRTDGVDSLLILYNTTPPSFDPAQRVVIT